jgi:MoxR-like ATPase
MAGTRGDPSEEGEMLKVLDRVRRRMSRAADAGGGGRSTDSSEGGKTRRGRRAARKSTMAQTCGCWEVTDAVMPYAERILLYGPPGTGKTFQGMYGCRSADQLVFAVTFTDETPAAEVRGHFVPLGDRFSWMDGPGVAAWRAGARLVLNELDHAGPDMLSFLLLLLDDPESARLTLPNGEMVQPFRPFSVVATMNGDPENLPAALRDRLPVAIEIDSVHPSALARLPEDIRGAALATVALPEQRRVSVRVWLEFARLREKVDEEVAAKATFGKRARDVLDALAIARG